LGTKTDQSATSLNNYLNFVFFARRQFSKSRQEQTRFLLFLFAALLRFAALSFSLSLSLSSACAAL